MPINPTIFSLPDHSYVIQRIGSYLVYAVDTKWG